ncbi:hypothetical protein [Hoylesella marshii]|uniref:HTH cro/C1-type domain-containing protein n=1 Tax=Hoylesella marshii DSM 16973 = JCM 13450 TaxID=862515 RepID=E0NSM8_9BACT|nr:hypothetical protein [Hoylesella marshii]EFM01871.1 hypothetical protein HMPREF0658_1179 [Hoylesella marshii DSM 16973 = JCM 13450]
MALSIEYRKKISAMLPLGAKTDIAEGSGLCRNNVYGWFNGKSSNPKIEKAVLDYFNSHIKKIETESQKRKEVMAFLDKID